MSLPLQSFAGKTGENAEELAEAHQAYDAVLPAVPAGDLVKVHMTLKDMVVEIAPGVEYNTWAFDGHGAPGPVVHVREGQTVEMTLTNGGAIPHSIDFHAARIAPNVAFKDVAPGESFTFRFKADDPGVYMYHCGTKPVLAHIANGMYGAIVVEPATPLPKADNEYVLVGERVVPERRRDRGAGLARHGQGARDGSPTGRRSTATRTSTSRIRSRRSRARRRALRGRRRADARHELPRRRHDLRPRLGERRHDAVPAGRADGRACPAGGGAVFDVKIDEPGLYPFVSHAFAHVDLGQVGLLKVGNPQGHQS